MASQARQIYNFARTGRGVWNIFYSGGGYVMSKKFLWVWEI